MRILGRVRNELPHYWRRLFRLGHNQCQVGAHSVLAELLVTQKLECGYEFLGL